MIDEASLFIDFFEIALVRAPRAPASVGVAATRDSVLFDAGRAWIIHLDAAIPLDADASIAGVQWLVSTHKTF